MPTANPTSFEIAILPHTRAAYRLARWLLRNDDAAQDVVQEASLRALRYFGTFTGGNPRAWFLTIVRNSCREWRYGGPAQTDPFDEEQHSRAALSSSDPEALLLDADERTRLSDALQCLPDRLRQLLVLREIEGLSYRELAAVTGVPIGTVMSRLSRARATFRDAVHGELKAPRHCGGKA